jgi:hypothetical protein
VTKDRLLVGLLAVAAVAAVATAVLGLVLADVYRPQGQSSATWRDWHLATGVAMFLTSAAAGILGLVRRSALLSVCAAAATAAAVVTLVTRPLVAWDQLALRAVTVGTDVSGYWPAAFDDEVLFVLVGGAEASPGEYAVALVLHLGVPVLGAVALLVATAAAARSGRRAIREDVAVAPVLA